MPYCIDAKIVSEVELNFYEARLIVSLAGYDWWLLRALAD